MRLILPFAEETEVDRLPRPGDSKTETADVRSRTEAGRKDWIIFCVFNGGKYAEGMGAEEKRRKLDMEWHVRHVRSLMTHMETVDE
jgi:hypothetical protein